MNSQSNDMKEMFNGVKCVKLEDNSMCSSNSFNQTQNQSSNQYQDLATELKTEFTVKGENLIQMPSFKEMTIRKPNDRQFVQFKDYFSRIEPESKPENLLLSINMNRDFNEPEWTLHQIYSTYEILVFGTKLPGGSKPRLDKKIKRAETEIDKFLYDLQFQLKTENMESQCQLYFSIDYSFIRKPTSFELGLFKLYYGTKCYFPKELLFEHLNNHVLYDEQQWTMAEIFATLEILVMGTRMSQENKVRLTEEQKRAQMNIKEFNQNYPHQFSQQQTFQSSNQYQDQATELKTEFTMKTENPIQMPSFKEMTIRKPNDRQIVQFKDYFSRIEPEAAPENLLLSINMNRDFNEPEWTLLQLYSTYEILVMGINLLRSSNTCLIAKQKRAQKEIDYFRKSLQSQPLTEFMDSKCQLFSSIDNIHIRKPSLPELSNFTIYFGRNYAYPIEKLLQDLNSWNDEEPKWTMAEVFTTYEMLVMGTLMSRKVRITKEQKRAQIDVNNSLKILY
ncbi:uncharacterized protein LOC128389893 [Panonychus citri]|uniref:uncharacterized protein LOC128389893 n=1 Tax=Panonychus citri TaxID=50023 RepID=UPI0023078959|nr:uncharacterized protein LOC128389893 [Panonychus citri]